jgi:Type 5 capsule protein repressor C-terminal domain
VDVAGTLDDLPGLAATTGDAYLRVSLSLDEPVPGVADRVREVLPNALDVRLVLPDEDERPFEPSLRGLGPKEQFVSYYETANAVPPPDDLLGAFDRVYEDVTVS